jgi:hypothetical protein
LDDDPDGLTFDLSGDKYILYRMTYAMRDDLLSCSVEPTYFVEAKHSPTGSRIETQHVGLCRRAGEGPLFEGRSEEPVNIVAILVPDHVSEVIEGKSAYFVEVGVARLSE